MSMVDDDLLEALALQLKGNCGRCEREEEEICGQASVRVGEEPRLRSSVGSWVGEG